MADQNNAPKPWEMQPEETTKAYEAFCVYRDMETKDRSIRLVAEKLQKSETLIGRWSRTYGWVKRVAAWDAELDRKTAQEMMKDIAKMRAKQRKMAVTMQLKGMNLLNEIKEGDAKLSEIVTLLKVSTELERICMGDVGEVIEERNGGDMPEPVTFYMPSNGRDKEEGENEDE